MQFLFTFIYINKGRKEKYVTDLNMVDILKEKANEKKAYESLNDWRTNARCAICYSIFTTKTFLRYADPSQGDDKFGSFDLVALVFLSDVQLMYVYIAYI